MRRIWHWVLSALWPCLLLFPLLFTAPLLPFSVALTVCSILLIPAWGRTAHAALALSAIMLAWGVAERIGEAGRVPAIKTRVILASLAIASDMYRDEFGAYPEGEIAAVVRDLRGGNPKKIVFVEFVSESMGPEGQILDAWRSPIRLLGGGVVPVFTSAGPDQIFGTGDDLSSDR